MSISPTNTHRAALKNLKDSLYPFAENDKLKDLLNRVEFTVAKCGFGASANPAHDTIALDPSLFQGATPSSFAVESALFELVNLSQKSYFQSLVNRIDKLDPDEFVKDYEHIEYQTALICKRILQKKLAPDQWDAYPLVYTTDSFQLHYLIQQLSGHSQKIYERYKDRFSTNETYCGSWQMPAEEEDRQILIELLSLKIGSEFQDTGFGKNAEASYKQMKNGVLNNPYYSNLTAYIQKIESITPHPPQIKNHQ